MKTHTKRPYNEKHTICFHIKNHLPFIRQFDKLNRGHKSKYGLLFEPVFEN